MLDKCISDIFDSFSLHLLVEKELENSLPTRTTLFFLLCSFVSLLLRFFLLCRFACVFLCFSLLWSFVLLICTRFWSRHFDMIKGNLSALNFFYLLKKFGILDLSLLARKNSFWSFAIRLKSKN